MLDFITINTQNSIRIDDAKTIYVDPFMITEQKVDADIILITHSHRDHLSPEAIRNVMKNDTIIVCPTVVKEQIDLELEIVQVTSDEKLEVKGISIETVPAYNVNKKFHPKENGWVGYIINSPEHGRIYIAGDTDITEENKNVKCDIALLPAGGTYTMDYKEAAELANTIRPEYAIPVHYGSIVGVSEDGEKFSRNVDDDIKVVIKL